MKPPKRQRKQAPSQDASVILQGLFEKEAIVDPPQRPRRKQNLSQPSSTTTTVPLRRRRRQQQQQQQQQRKRKAAPAAANAPNRQGQTNHSAQDGRRKRLLLHFPQNKDEQSFEKVYTDALHESMLSHPSTQLHRISLWCDPALADECCYSKVTAKENALKACWASVFPVANYTKDKNLNYAKRFRQFRSMHANGFIGLCWQGEPGFKGDKKLIELPKISLEELNNLTLIMIQKELKESNPGIHKIINDAFTTAAARGREIISRNRKFTNLFGNIMGNVKSEKERKQLQDWFDQAKKDYQQDIAMAYLPCNKGPGITTATATTTTNTTAAATEKSTDDSGEEDEVPIVQLKRKLKSSKQSSNASNSKETSKPAAVDTNDRQRDPDSYQQRDPGAAVATNKTDNDVDPSPEQQESAKEKAENSLLEATDASAAKIVAAKVSNMDSTTVQKMTTAMAVLEQLRQHMGDATLAQNYILAGQLQTEVTEMEELQRDMEEAAQKKNFIEAGDLQSKFIRKALTFQVNEAGPPDQNLSGATDDKDIPSQPAVPLPTDDSGTNNKMTGMDEATGAGANSNANANINQLEAPDADRSSGSPQLNEAGPPDQKLPGAAGATGIPSQPAVVLTTDDSGADGANSSPNTNINQLEAPDADHSSGSQVNEAGPPDQNLPGAAGATGIPSQPAVPLTTDDSGINNNMTGMDEATGAGANSSPNTNINQLEAPDADHSSGSQVNEAGPPDQNLSGATDDKDIPSQPAVANADADTSAATALVALFGASPFESLEVSIKREDSSDPVGVNQVPVQNMMVAPDERMDGSESSNTSPAEISMESSVSIDEHTTGSFW